MKYKNGYIMSDDLQMITGEHHLITNFTGDNLSAYTEAIKGEVGFRIKNKAYCQNGQLIEGSYALIRMGDWKNPSHILHKAAALIKKKNTWILPVDFHVVGFEWDVDSLKSSIDDYMSSSNDILKMGGVHSTAMSGRIQFGDHTHMINELWIDYDNLSTAMCEITTMGTDSGKNIQHILENDCTLYIKPIMIGDIKNSVCVSQTTLGFHVDNR